MAHYSVFNQDYKYHLKSRVSHHSMDPLEPELMLTKKLSLKSGTVMLLTAKVYEY